MKSCYYECWLMSDKRAPGVQDDYEEKLGFPWNFCDCGGGISEQSFPIKKRAEEDA